MAPSLALRTAEPRGAQLPLPWSGPLLRDPLISQHPGPARRFCFMGFCSELYDAAESWFNSRALSNLQELDISFLTRHNNFSLLLPQSTLLPAASTLLVAEISNCDFPHQIAPPVNFPFLKQLSLFHVLISGSVFHDLLSLCHALESLFISDVRVADHLLRVSSPTLRSIAFSDSREIKLVIEDAPRLERLLLPYYHRDDSMTIQVIRAPKLEIFGPYSTDFFSKVRIFQGMSRVSSANPMRTLKVLALRSCGRGLHTLLNALRGFPRLERLYVIFYRHYEMGKKSEPQYDPLNPIECLQICLKKVVFKSYLGFDQLADLVRFFVLIAKVLNKIEFEGSGEYNSESVARQCRLLQVENRTSRDAKFEFRNASFSIDYHLSKLIHDLSVGDPFRQP